MKKPLISILLLLVLAAIIYGLHDKFEKVTKEIDIGFTGEARTNPLFASRLFLKKMGIPAEPIDIYRLENLPGIKTIIVIDTYRSTLSSRRIDQLMAWVKRGGHLITIINPDFEDTEENTGDPLQNHLNIQADNTRYFDDENFDSESCDNPSQDEVFDYSVQVSLKGLPKCYTLNIEQFHPIHSNATNDEVIHIDGSAFLLNRSYGDGLISIASDLEFAENNHIAEANHAEFFWQLVHRKYSLPENVWLLNSDDMPALWEWLWQHAWQLILTLSLLLFLWLYGLSHRFGPIIPSKALDRRRLLEHIQASGHFFWKQNQQDKLINSCRQGVLQKLGSHFPAWHQLDINQQLKLASEYSELPIDKLRPLLFGKHKLSMEEFVHAVQQLEEIRKR